MKKLVLAFGALFAMSLLSCSHGNQEQGNSLVDSTQVELATDSAGSEVTGIAVDGAMNSIYLKVGDDTVMFSYPDIDSEHRASWDVGDTVTVRYYVTENGDSVTDVILGDIS
jgi:hypothetical protein